MLCMNAGLADYPAGPSSPPSQASHPLLDPNLSGSPHLTGSERASSNDATQLQAHIRASDQYCPAQDESHSGTSCAYCLSAHVCTKLCCRTFVDSRGRVRQQHVDNPPPFPRPPLQPPLHPLLHHPPHTLPPTHSHSRSTSCQVVIVPLTTALAYISTIIHYIITPAKQQSKKLRFNSHTVLRMTDPIKT